MNKSYEFAIIRVLPFLNNPKDLDPSYKMGLDFWDCFGRKKLCLITEEYGTGLSKNPDMEQVVSWTAFQLS